MTVKSREAGFVGGLTLGLFGGAVLGVVVTLMAIVSIVGPGN